MFIFVLFSFYILSFSFFYFFFFFFSSRRRHTRCSRDWSSDVCSSDLGYVSKAVVAGLLERGVRGKSKSRVHALVVPTTRAEHLAPHVTANVKPGSEMITDMNRSYWEIGRASCRERV